MEFLTLAENSLHGSLPSPDRLLKDNQQLFFTVPDNVIVMFRGAIGFCQYTIPGVIDSIMGRSTESFTNMLKRHNNKDKLYGPLYYYNSGSQCINFAYQDDPGEEKLGDISFAINVNGGKRIGKTLDIIPSGSLDDRITVTTICNDDIKKQYFESLKNIRKSSCKANQALTTTPALEASRFIYLIEIINLLINMYNINENNQLVLYISSCQPIDEDWENTQTLQDIINIAIKAEQLGFQMYNPLSLEPDQKGISLEERADLKLTKHDHDLFYGDPFDGYLDIPDRRYYPELLEKFPGILQKRGGNKKLISSNKKSNVYYKMSGNVAKRIGKIERKLSKLRTSRRASRRSARRSSRRSARRSSRRASRRSARRASRRSARRASRRSARRASRRASRRSSRRASKRGSRRSSRRSSRRASKRGSRRASKRGSRRASKRGSRRASRRSSRRASKRGSRRASRRSSRRASKRGSRRASKRGSRSMSSYGLAGMFKAPAGWTGGAPGDVSRRVGVIEGRSDVSSGSVIAPRRTLISLQRDLGIAAKTSNDATKTSVTAAKKSMDGAKAAEAAANTARTAARAVEAAAGKATDAAKKAIEGARMAGDSASKSEKSTRMVVKASNDVEELIGMRGSMAGGQHRTFDF
jgi:hypothetical protein